MLPPLPFDGFFTPRPSVEEEEKGKFRLRQSPTCLLERREAHLRNWKTFGPTICRQSQVEADQSCLGPDSLDDDKILYGRGIPSVEMGCE